MDVNETTFGVNPTVDAQIVATIDIDRSPIIANITDAGTVMVVARIHVYSIAYILCFSAARNCFYNAAKDIVFIHLFNKYCLLNLYP